MEIDIGFTYRNGSSKFMFHTGIKNSIFFCYNQAGIPLYFVLPSSFRPQVSITSRIFDFQLSFPFSTPLVGLSSIGALVI